MNENEKQKLQTSTSQFSQFLKMTLQFLVSVSLISILLSYSSGLSHFFYYFKFHFSTLISPLFSHTLDRKYMFLICNGIVAFLAINLSFTSSSDEDAAKPVSEAEPQLQHKEAAMESTLGPLENDSRIEKQEYKQENESMNIEVQRRENRAMIMKTQDDEEKEARGSLIPPSSTEDEGNEVNVSSEELNRRFDEFIRKVKEEIRIDARRQPIAE